MNQSDIHPRLSPSVLALLALIAAALLSTLVVSHVPSPSDDRLWGEIFNAGHAPLFGVVSVIFLLLSINLLHRRLNSRIKHYLLVAGVCLFLGVATEIIQGFIGRDADVVDTLRDVAGFSAFLGIVATFDPWLTSPQLRNSEIRKTYIRSVGLLLLFVAATPILISASAYYQRDREFPVLCSFELPKEQYFQETHSLQMEITDPPAAWTIMAGHKVAKLTFEPADYPGVTFSEPYPDWTGYSRLSFGIFSPQNHPVDLYIRINDSHHNFELNDRFNSRLDVNPGANSFSIPLDSVRLAPVGRQMDMKKIAQIILFAASPADTFSVYLGPLLLQ
ncbi:MAG TPA: VanZ family protein [Candidatus Acidoferrum sp.]|nr:VanZ family protein [Candidatus Acidoferrum sp.]